MGEAWPQIRDDVAGIKKRMFVDNGHDSIQTSLATGAMKFKEIDSKLDTISGEVKSLSAHVAGLAGVIKTSTELQNGVACEGLTTEGLVREVLKKMPSSAGSSNTAMWVSLSVVAICVTAIFFKVMG